MSFLGQRKSSGTAATVTEARTNTQYQYNRTGGGLSSLNDRDYLQEPELYIDEHDDVYDLVRQPCERLTISFNIPEEPEFQCDYMGECGCDACQESGHPIELWKGMTFFNIGGKQIYCDCLEEFLKKRLVTA